MGAGATKGPAVDAPRETAPQPEPLGPDSLTWKYFGDLRTGMLSVWIGVLQNMYPELGAGVEEHSILLREPLQRVTRSVFPIMGVVYDGDRAAQTGAQIRGYHHTIKGVDAEGRRYHALNPETFYWAHATFFILVLKTAEYFCGGLTEAEKRQLFDEHVQWYRIYGMSMRPVPKTFEEFQDYWQWVCREQLEINRATLDILQMRIPKPKYVLMPTKLWDQLFKPLVAGQRWLAAGLFDPVVREKAGMRWTPGDEVLLRLFGKFVDARFWWYPTRTGCIRAPCRHTSVQRASCRRMRRWPRPRRSPLRRATAGACRCITRRAAERSWSAPGRWCTPAFRWPAGCVRPATEAPPNLPGGDAVVSREPIRTGRSPPRLPH